MLPKEYDIQDRTVIVTAASRGIGKGIARVLSGAGAKVLVTALTERYLRPLAEEMASAGHPIEILKADATSAEDWQLSVDTALQRWGHIDVLINALGDSIRNSLVPLPGSDDGSPISDEEWRFVLDINLTQAFMGCRAVGTHFIERGKGKVINISGLAGHRGSPKTLAYSSAKAGLNCFTQTLALEWAPHGVTVNGIAPGNFPDPETNDPAELAARGEAAKATIPLGRYGDLRDCGLLALYLASDASNYLTGVTIPIDGGMNAVGAPI